MVDPDTITNDANDFKDIAAKSQSAGIADESAAYENALDGESKSGQDTDEPSSAGDRKKDGLETPPTDEPSAHPS